MNLWRLSFLINEYLYLILSPLWYFILSHIDMLCDLSLYNSFWNQRFMCEMVKPSLTWFSVPVTHTNPENPNMVHTREDAIRSGKCSDLGQKTVGIQDLVCNIGKVVGIKYCRMIYLNSIWILKVVIINTYFDWPSLICYL